MSHMSKQRDNADNFIRVFRFLRTYGESDSPVFTCGRKKKYSSHCQCERVERIQFRGVFISRRKIKHISASTAAKWLKVTDALNKY